MAKCYDRPSVDRDPFPLSRREGKAASLFPSLSRAFLLRDHYEGDRADPSQRHRISVRTRLSVRHLARERTLRGEKRGKM